ncbi:MAG TPA: hypothetical protein VN881_03735 [Candidatus Acidoferrales bacterium]|nr:hypothetical protein [Candidatus Acidoferrales bacterium]
MNTRITSNSRLYHAVAGLLFAFLCTIGLPKVAFAQGCPNQTCVNAGDHYTCNGSAQAEYCSNHLTSCTDQLCKGPAPVQSNSHPQPGKHDEGCPVITLADLKVIAALHDGIELGIVESESNAPVVLVQATHGLSDLLEDGNVENVSTKTVAAYRIGWALQFPNQPLQFHLGQWMNIPIGIKPGASQDVPAQNVSSNGLAKSGVTGVKFFVAEVRYADGTSWKTDFKKYRGSLKEVPHPIDGATM